MVKDLDMWNTALDIAHIEHHYDKDISPPLHIRNRLNTLYRALSVLNTQNNTDRVFNALDKLLYDRLVANTEKLNPISIYAEAIALLNSARIKDDSNVEDILEDAHKEVTRRFSLKKVKENA